MLLQGNHTLPHVINPPVFHLELTRWFPWSRLVIFCRLLVKTLG